LPGAIGFPHGREDRTMMARRWPCFCPTLFRNPTPTSVDHPIPILKPSRWYPDVSPDPSPSPTTLSHSPNYNTKIQLQPPLSPFSPLNPPSTPQPHT
jgi:hypothetical protein